MLRNIVGRISTCTLCEFELGGNDVPCSLQLLKRSCYLRHAQVYRLVVCAFDLFMDQVVPA